MSQQSAKDNLAFNGYNQAQQQKDPNAGTYVNDFRGYNAQGSNAAQINTANSNQDRGNQQALAGQLGLAAQGMGPSAAQAQLAQSTDANVKNAAALSAAAGAGGSAGAARYNAANQAGELNAQAGNQSAQLAAQQQQQAQGALGNLYAGMSSQDAQNAQAQAGLNQQTALANAQAQNQAGQFNSQSQQNLAGLQGAQYQFGQNFQKSEQDQYNQAIAGQAATQAANSTFGVPNTIISGVLSAGSSAAGAAAAASDERSKDVIGETSTAKSALRRYLHALNGRVSPFSESAPATTKPEAPRTPLGPAPGTGLKRYGPDGYHGAADDAGLWTSRSDENAKTDVTNSVGALRNYLSTLNQVSPTLGPAAQPPGPSDPSGGASSSAGSMGSSLTKLAAGKGGGGNGGESDASLAAAAASNADGSMTGLQTAAAGGDGGGGGESNTGAGNNATRAAASGMWQRDMMPTSSYNRGNGQMDAEGKAENDIYLSTGVALSDEDQKTGITNSPESIRDLLRKVQPHEYEYKDPGGPLEPPGKHFGVMAQELEKSPVGKSFVTDTPDGKVVNYGQMAGVQMAGLADHEDRIADLEKMLAATKKARGKR